MDENAIDSSILYYTYNCPICNHMVEVGFYCEPSSGHTFTCDANGNPHDLLIDSVDYDNMTMEVEDFYLILRKDFEDYYKEQGREVPNDLYISYIED